MDKMNYLLDTYVIVQAINSGLALPAARYFISSLTYHEVMACETLTAEDKKLLNQIFKKINILQPNETIKKDAKILEEKYAISNADALICATAYLYNLTLITNDSTLKKVTEINIEPFYFV